MQTCGRGLSLSQLDGTGTTEMVLQGGLALEETRKLSVAGWERDWPEPRDDKKQTVPRFWVGCRGLSTDRERWQGFGSARSGRLVSMWQP